MTNEEIQNQVESSAALSALRDRIANALAAQTENRYAFNPLLIVAIISVMVQVIQYCRENRSAEDIASDIKNVRSLRPRQLMRFKRRSNVLWKEYCAANGLDADTPNPIPDAVYALGDDADTAAVRELIALAG